MVGLLGGLYSYIILDGLCGTSFRLALCVLHCSCSAMVGICLTRLETRTKEFSMCASHGVLRNLKAQ